MACVRCVRFPKKPKVPNTDPITGSGTDPITESASQNIESQRNGSITLALAGGQAAPSACMNEGREWRSVRRTVVVVVGVALRWWEGG